MKCTQLCKCLWLRTVVYPREDMGRGSPVGRRLLWLVRFAAAARSTVDCQCAIGRFSLFSWKRPTAHSLKVRQKQSSFNTQNIPILGAGADAAAGAVYRDTCLATFTVFPLIHWKLTYVYLTG